MKKRCSTALACLALWIPGLAEQGFYFKESASIYNGENGYWDQSRVTITYLENLLEPGFYFQPNERFRFTAGVGLLVPFNQEEKIFQYYPFVQAKAFFPKLRITLGSLDGAHDFPAPILDPLVQMTPQIRNVTLDAIPIPYERFPVTGLMSHGRYEYGLSFAWEALGKGELYINWQLADTTNHRERFDVGLAHRFDWKVPGYLGVHYWHNGGHENPHPVAITENYTGAIGIRHEKYSVLYLPSLWVPGRDRADYTNVFGQAIYASVDLDILKWVLHLEAFVSDEWILTNNRFISIEGDPFYRLPFYFGFNLSRTWKLHESTALTVGFINGICLPHPPITSLRINDMLRYDQTIRLDVKYEMPFGKRRPRAAENPPSTNRGEAVSNAGAAP